MKKILLGVTASVAAIKILNLTLALREFAEVKIVVTTHGEYFLQPYLAALPAISIYRDADEWQTPPTEYSLGQPILHIELRRWADLLLVAPLDANTLAKICYGVCDNLLTSVIRAWDYQKPIVLCPAMNTLMWHNPPTAEQVAVLQQRGCHILAPIEKKLACNDIGMGAMAEVETIVTYVKHHF